MDDATMAKLEKLASLKASGVLSEEEVAKQKAAILSGGAAQAAVAVVVPETSPATQQGWPWLQGQGAQSGGGDSQYERERREREERREYQDRQDRLERQERQERVERQERAERQERMQMERMQGERAMIANIQGLHAGGGPRKFLTPVEWLKGAWTKEGDNCCNPPRPFVLTPMGENSFKFDGPTGTNMTNYIFTGRYTRNGEESSTFKGTATGKTVKELTVVDENTMTCYCAPEGGAAFTVTITKDEPTSNKAKQGMAPVPEVMRAGKVRL